MTCSILLLTCAIAIAVPLVVAIIGLLAICVIDGIARAVIRKDFSERV